MTFYLKIVKLFENVNFLSFLLLTTSSNIFHIFAFYFLKGTLIKQTIIKQKTSSLFD